MIGAQGAVGLLIAAEVALVGLPFQLLPWSAVLRANPHATRSSRKHDPITR
jgi:hypothetical protein